MDTTKMQAHHAPSHGGLLAGKVAIITGATSTIDGGRLAGGA